MLSLNMSSILSAGAQSGNTVQDKQGIPEILLCTEAVTEHLFHMGGRFIPKTVTNDTVPIMNLGGQEGEAERFGSLSGWHAGGAKKVPVDKRGLR